jgi:hypothetical protein
VYKKFRMKILALALICTLAALMRRPDLIVSGDAAHEIRIFGLVNRPLNLTYDELLSLPTVSETINVECVFHFPNVTFNWTGVPLFHLLTLAQVKQEARKVVFRAPNDFSSSLTIEEALKPNVILALRANGTLLSDVSWIGGIQGGFRMVVPCKWGYKWVTSVREIEVVDYDYKGTYESNGFSDEADIPNCVSPSIDPPLQVFDLSFGLDRSFQVRLFSNASVAAFSFNYLQREIDLNVSLPTGERGFANVILQQVFLRGPYSVTVDENATDAIEAGVTDLSFLYMVLPEGSHAIRIVGTEFFGRIPEILVEFNQTVHVGESVDFNASESRDPDGNIVSFDWNFGDGVNGTGPVVHHSYSKEGTYYAMLNVTDNDGLSNSRLLIVTVERQPQYVPFFLKLFLAALLGFLALIFVILLFTKKARCLVPKLV